MKWKLFLSLVLVGLVAILSVVIFVRMDTPRQVSMYMARGGMIGLDSLATSLEDYYNEFGSWNGVDGLLSTSHGMGGAGGRGSGGMMGQRLQLADKGGMVLADTAGSAVGNQLGKDDLEAAIQLNDQNNQIIGYLLPAGGVNYRQGDEIPLIERLNTAALQAALVAGVIAMVLAILTAIYLLRPVQKLTLAAEKMGKGDLNQRVEVRGKDELAVLGNTFNSMAESLQKSELRRREMTADVAHELRNPLAVQKAQLEAMMDGVYPISAENLQAALDQNTLLTRLVGDLRTLALAEAGELTLEQVEIDPGLLLVRVVERHRPLAEKRNIQLTLVSNGGQAGYLIGDPDRLDQILGNLLSNAFRYTPDGGQITLELVPSGTSIGMMIHDSGPGIPDDALPHIFERFYRADKSRSRQEGGTGLGLAIARLLTQLMGGTIMAENHPSGGAIFTLQFPKA